MPIFESGDLRLHYEETGIGFPVLLFAPGGMKSAIPFWDGVEWNRPGASGQPGKQARMVNRGKPLRRWSVIDSSIAWCPMATS